jgi:hypothetical protein
MKRILSLNLFLGLGLLLHAQVYINVDETDQASAAILQADAEDKGVAFPHVYLENTTSALPITGSPAEGLIVYNPNLTSNIEPGYYYWTNSPSPHWERIGGIKENGTIIQNIDREFLGYNPTGMGANAPTTFSISTGTATKQRCVKWEINEGGNGHVYCAYTANVNTNFETTFNAIKNLNGYMVTIVSQKEWDFVLKNVIQNQLNLGGSLLNQGIWLGYLRFTTPGNNTPKYQWITNESWENNWSNNPTTQHNFTTGQPTNPCTFIQTTAASSIRAWSSQACSSTSNMSNLIVEFNQ